MGILSKVLYEFEEREPGYYFQVFLTKPQDNKVPVSTKMWETEKEALYDLPFIVPSLVSRDIKDPDALIFKDASIINKTIYIAKIEKPTRMDVPFVRIEDIEKDTVQRYLNKNNIMFKVKLQTALQTASRNKIINMVHIDMRDSLNNTEFTKKCVRYVYKDDPFIYDRFLSGLSDSIMIAYYDAYLGIPNPRNNVKMLDKFYTELRKAMNAANNDIMSMGYKVEMFGEWDRGNIVLQTLAKSIGEASIIYEEPSTLKINGQPADEEGEEDDNVDYRIADDEGEGAPADEPAQEPSPAEETPAEEPAAEEESEAEDEPAPADYRIPDTADDAPAEETPAEPAEGEEGEAAPEGEEDDAPVDYRVNTDDEGEAAPEGEEETPADDTEDESGEEEYDDLQAREDELMAEIPPEQRKLQDEELKDNYIKLYNTIGEIMARLDKINLSTDNTSPVTFIQNQLSDMKDYVYKYLSSVYSTKTYIENNINYQQYLVILANINTLLIQLDVKSSDID